MPYIGCSRCTPAQVGTCPGTTASLADPWPWPWIAGALVVWMLVRQS